MIIEFTKQKTAQYQTPRRYGKTTDGGDDNDVFHVSVDARNESVVGVLVNAVAALHNKPPEALRPLANSIDPDLLEDLVDPDSTETIEGGELTFRYEGLEVTVDTDGDVWLKWM